MEVLLNYQQNIATRIRRAYENYKKSPKDRIKQAYCKSRLETLTDTWKEFVTGHQNLMLKCKTDELNADRYMQQDVFGTTEEIYIEYKTILLEELFKFEKGGPTPNAPQCTNNSLKLPRINIPPFSGKYIEWTTFHDLFTSIVHNNETLDSVQKFHYLKSLLTGEAEQLVRHIPITFDNYMKCWDLLKSRYNNKKYLSHYIIKRFLSQRNAMSESASYLKELIDTSSDCLNALSNLGIDVSTWDIIIIHILSLKLDVETRKQWELNVTSNTSSDALPTFEQFKEFITNRFRALEFVEQKQHGKSQLPNWIVGKPRALHVAGADQLPLQCPFCSEAHVLHLCKQFIAQDTDSRRDFVQSNGICFNCLGTNHPAKFCKNSNKCKICKRHHHSLLHPKPPVKGKFVGAAVTEDSEEEEGVEEEPQEEIQTHTAAVRNHSVLLATALVNAQSSNENYFTVRALLDQGSQASFVTEATVQMLKLKKIPIKGLISGVGDGNPIHSNSVVELKLRSVAQPTVQVQVRAHVLKSITSFLPSKKVVEWDWLKTSQIKLADPQYYSPNKIDILLGAEIYSQIIQGGIIKDPTGLLVAQATAFGWVISGLINSQNKEPIMVMHASVTCENDMLKQFWELESDPPSPFKLFSPEEAQCEKIFVDTTTRDESGRFIVNLPFKTEDPPCQYGNSREIARKRFIMLENRLIKNPELKIEYSRVIHEYLNLEHMSIVPESEIMKSGAVYLPHHAVVRQDKTTSKVRVVFDASCKGSNGVSLNDDLMTGPTLQLELRHLLMRWRSYPIALVADIVKMYRQVKVTEKDADFQRILWRDHPDDELQHLKLTRVAFGTSSAPYLAVRALQEVAYQEGSNFPLAAIRVLEDFYMDDLLTGCRSVNEGIELCKQINELLNKAGFQLQKWTSNNEKILEQITKVEKNKEEVKDKIFDIKTDSIIKILGLTWNRCDDSYQYKVTIPELKEPITKRAIISDIAKLFDPLGWLAPAIIIAKTLIQKLWLTGIGWDDEVPHNLLNEWKTYRKELKLLEQVNIPRYLGAGYRNNQVELHGYSDASQVAYAAAVYIRIIDEKGEIHVHLVTSKTKVAPVKQVSIPRLELCGAVLLAKLISEVGVVMGIPKNSWFTWTDSTVVLAWLNSHPSRWKTFIGNRVSHILESLEPHQWAHVQSKSNPADVASRGLRPSELVKSSLWFDGPEMLKNKEITRERPKNLDTNLEEIKRKMHTYVATEQNEIWNRYSSLTKLVRVIAYCRRFINNMKKPMNERPTNTILSSKELLEATETCIKLNQGENYGGEIKALKSGKGLKRTSKLLTLSPFLDDNQVLRVGGRLENSKWTERRKHPIIISKTGNFTKLLIDNAHKSTLHGGPQLMLSFLLTKYWIIGAKQLVKSHVRKCTVCIRNTATTKTQLMGQLPSVRVTPSRPFLNSGVDYAGPINIRTTKGRGHRSYKGYICLFICMVTRAVHIEVVSDLTSQGFLAAFKRFVARRGYCSNLYSDNGTNFVGADRELRMLLDLERSRVARDITESLASNGTSWHFIPPHAPNFGGLWEAAIKSTKFHLKRVIGDTTLTYEELSTVLAQVEACLNSRPLSRIEADSDSETVLTPGHFLVGEPLLTAPDRNFETSNISTLRRWQLTQRILQDFWRLWSQDLMHNLQQKYKWKYQNPEPQEGDVVLVKEDGLPPSKWLLGRIITKHPDSHNVTRVVTLRTKNSVIKRPTSKLCILPVSD